MSAQLESAIRKDRAVVIAALMFIITAAWAWLIAGAGMSMNAIDMTRMVYGDHSVMKAGMSMQPAWDLAYWTLMFFMWWVMMIAMMLPSAAPVVLLASMIGRKAQPKSSPYGSTSAFLLGYLVAWGLFSLLATAGQWALEQAQLLSSMTMNTRNRWLGSGLLLAAAAWQFTPVKQACLKHCRSPVDFLVEHHGHSGFRMGMEHGGWCLGCCWFLMLLLFVGGVMNLFWIAGLAVVVLLEKLLPTGVVASRVAGALLALAAIWMLAGL